MTPAIRPAHLDDLGQLTDIYNYYVLNTPITFDLDPFTAQMRHAWFDQHGSTGRHRLLVAEGAGTLLGYASTSRFRPKAAYDTTVETSVYCRHTATSKGIGRALYDALFNAILNEDIHQLVAGITLPNDASVALHERCGFKKVGVFSANGRKFGKYWDVAWFERSLRV